MTQIQGGSEAALDCLIQRHWSVLVRYAFGFLHCADDAEDVVQEAFVRVWQKRESWTPEGSVTGYIYGIVRNLCINEAQRRSVREKWAEREERRSRYSPTPAEVMQQHDVLDALEVAIDALPERRREVFVLTCLHGLSYREVADAMGIRVPTVANQVSSALDALREALHSVSDLTI